jgi:hypothetical protein
VKRLSFVAVLLLASLLAAACGSSKSQSTSAADWADGVCSAISTWGNSLKSAGGSLTGGDISKDSLQSAADDVTSATETLESDLKDLGKPNTQAGQQAKETIDQFSSELKSDTDSITKAVDEASGASGIVSAVGTISTTLMTMGKQVSSTLKTLEQLDAKGELQTAFQQSSNCKQLSTSS